MPFEKGNQLARGQGRKGFEMERTQFERMKALFDQYIGIMERVYAGKSTDNDYRVLQTLGPDMRKVLDKLHANKQEVKQELEVNVDLKESVLEALSKIYKNEP